MFSGWRLWCTWYFTLPSPESSFRITTNPSGYLRFNVFWACLKLFLLHLNYLSQTSLAFSNVFLPQGLDSCHSLCKECSFSNILMPGLALYLGLHSKITCFKRTVTYYPTLSLSMGSPCFPFLLALFASWDPYSLDMQTPHEQSSKKEKRIEVNPEKINEMPHIS